VLQLNGQRLQEGRERERERRKGENRISTKCGSRLVFLSFLPPSLPLSLPPFLLQYVPKRHPLSSISLARVNMPAAAAAATKEEEDEDERKEEVEAGREDEDKGEDEEGREGSCGSAGLLRRRKRRRETSRATFRDHLLP